MKTGFPEITNNIYRQPKEHSNEKKNKQSPPKMSYRGITLKQYFRICDEVKPNDTLGQINQQSCASSNSSIPQTPSFNHDDIKSQYRGKIKTEVCQIDQESFFKKTLVRVHEVDEKSRMAHPLSLEKNHKGHYFPAKKKEERKKIYTKVYSQSNKEQANIRSTLNSFYQVEENKKRMLKKIQQEKDRVNDLRLSEAFFITKYGSRFRIDSKTLKG